MASSSSSCDASPSPAKTDSYKSSREIFKRFPKPAKFKQVHDTPFSRLLYLIQSGQLNATCHPVLSVAPEKMPYLSKGSIKTLGDRLTKPVSFGGVEVVPLELLKGINVLAGITHWATFVRGSVLSTDDHYCDEFRRMVFKNLDHRLHPSLRKSFASSADCHDLDIVIRMKLGEGANAVQDLESYVTRALRDLVKDKIAPDQLINHFRFYMKGPTPLGDYGTVFTIGDKHWKLDLVLLYSSEKEDLSELFTRHGILLDIGYLLHVPVERWTDFNLQPQLVGVTPENFFVDRCTSIVRYEPWSAGANQNNWGLFVKYLVEQTKGRLSVQEGCQKNFQDIYKENRKDPRQVVRDARESYKDHLPNTFGVLIAHWLHWMTVVERAERIALSQQLKSKKYAGAPDYLTKTYDFIKNYPEQFQFLLLALQFSALLGYLHHPENKVTCGMWEGHLCLRLCLDETAPAYFQHPVCPLATLNNMGSFLKNSLIAEDVKIAVKELIRAYFSHFELEEGFTPDPNALRLFNQAYRLERRLQHLWGLFNPTLAIPDSPVPLNEEPEEVLKSDSTPPATPEPVAEVSVLEKLIKRSEEGVPEQRLNNFGNRLWSHFEEWSVTWGEDFPPEQEQQALLRILYSDSGSKALLNTLNEERRLILKNLIRTGFTIGDQLQLLTHFKSKQQTLFTEADLYELLQPVISACFDHTLLLKLSELLPEAVENRVMNVLAELPERKRLSQIILILKKGYPNKFDTMRQVLVNQLIIAGRGAEIAGYALGVKCREYFNNLFTHFLKAGDHAQAAGILEQWKVHSGTPLISKELELLEAIVPTPMWPIAMRKTVKIWSLHKKQHDETAQRIMTLCRELIITPWTLPIDVDSVPSILKIFWIGEQRKLFDLTPTNWNVLIANLGNFSLLPELWETLNHLIQNYDLWNNKELSIELFFKHILNQALKNNGAQARTKHLFSMIETLQKRFEWGSKFNLSMALVVKNLMEMTESSLDASSQAKAWCKAVDIMKNVVKSPIPLKKTHVVNRIHKALHELGVKKKYLASDVRAEERFLLYSQIHYYLLAMIFFAIVFLWAKVKLEEINSVAEDFMPSEPSSSTLTPCQNRVYTRATLDRRAP